MFTYIFCTIWILGELGSFVCFFLFQKKKKKHNNLKTDARKMMWKIYFFIQTYKNSTDSSKMEMS